MMKRALGILILVVAPLCASGVSGQAAPQPTFTDTERDLGLAAIRWYLGYDHSIREQHKTVLVSDVSSGGGRDPEMEASPPLQRGQPLVPKRIGLSSPALDNIRSMGVPVVQCDSVDRATGDACGASGPWVWIVLSNAAVHDDHATINVIVRWLKEGVPSTDILAPMEAQYRVRLTRQNKRWRVESFDPLSG